MSAQIERRVVGLAACPVKLETRKDGDKEKQMFVGYAAVFYDPADAGTEYVLYPGMRERVMPTAFDRCVREAQDLRGLFNHEANHLLGRCSSGTMRVAVDKRGLRYEIDYDENDPDHRSVMAKMQRGDLTGSSFSFMVAPNGQKFSPGGPDADDVRELHDVDVLDVGPVTFPAYAGTSSSIRAIGDPGEIRSACPAEERGAIRYLEGPLIDEDDWDADAALARVRAWASDGDRMNFRKFSRAFGHSDGSATEGGHRLLHHDVRGGKLHVHKGAVQRCMRMLDAEDGGGVPEDDRAACRSHLERHRDAFGDEDGDEAGERERKLESERRRMRIAEAQ